MRRHSSSLFALPLALIAHAIAISLLLLLGPAKKPKNQAVSMRAISRDSWARNRGQPTTAAATALKEKAPKGQVVDVARGNDRLPTESKYLAETNNRVKNETVAREQTNRYSRATPKTQANPEARPAPRGAKEGRAAPPVSAVSALDRFTGNNGKPMRLAQLMQEAAARREQNPDAPQKAGAEDGEVAPETPGDATDPGGGAPNDALKDVEKGDATALNTRAWKYASFFNRVKQAVSARWDPMGRLRTKDPRAAQLGMRDRITVLGVALRPDGTIADIYVSESSGLEVLDMESIQAFERAAPFPNPPEALVQDGLIRFAFSFNVMNEGPRFR